MSLIEKNNTSIVYSLGLKHNMASVTKCEFVQISAHAHMYDTNNIKKTHKISVEFLVTLVLQPVSLEMGFEPRNSVCP